MPLRIVRVLVVVAACLFSLRADASDLSGNSRIEWTWVFREGVRLVAERAIPRMKLAPRPAIFETPMTAPVFGSDVGFSLMARNRGSLAPLLGGDPRSAVDFANVQRSARMLVGRVTWGGGLVQPFAQVGIGQWRRESERPFRGDIWYGVQCTAGVQVRMGESLALALEVNQAHVRLGDVDLRGDYRRIRGAFVALRLRWP